jgi:uncharacterized protein (DUF934 family)
MPLPELASPLPLRDVSPSPRRGGVRGGGQQQTPTRAQAAAPHPNPHPTEERGEGTDGAIWKDGAFRHDTWVKADADAALPDGPVIVSKKRWLAERERLGPRNAPLGLFIEAGETIDDVAADLPRFALIALSFPKFRDGRAFSTARLLREKHGYAGELRAVGNVLSDLIPFMRRVGFDAFEVSHLPTRRALAEGRIPEVALHYQPAAPGEPPAAGPRPWLRRPR